jgi:hypothetical protein
MLAEARKNTQYYVGVGKDQYPRSSIIYNSWEELLEGREGEGGRG